VTVKILLDLANFYRFISSLYKYSDNKLEANQLSYHSKVYLTYFSIDASNYVDKIACYENRYQEIEELVDIVRTEIELDYTISLFQVGRYHQYISQSTPLIEKVITENIHQIEGEDIFQKLLFNKAASYFNVNDFEKANHIMLELCKMDPHNQTYYAFSSKILRMLSYRKFDKIKAAALGMILLALAIIVFEILIARTLIEDVVSTLNSSRNVLMGCSVGLLVLHEVRLRLHIRNIIKAAIATKSAS